jgi:hypothetical protein
MELEKYMRESRQTIKQANKMKNKVQALKLLDKHEDKWEEYKRNILIEILVNKNAELDEVHSELSHCWNTVMGSMTTEELDKYGATLPDEILDSNWTRQQIELIHLIFAAIYPKCENEVECPNSEKSENTFVKCIKKIMLYIFQNGGCFASVKPSS